MTIAKRPSVGRDDSIYSCFYLAVKLNSEIRKQLKIQLRRAAKRNIFTRETWTDAIALIAKENLVCMRRPQASDGRRLHAGQRQIEFGLSCAVIPGRANGSAQSAAR